MLMLVAACGTTGPPESLSGTLPVNAPNYVSAGDPIDVSIGPVSQSEGQSLGLVVVGNDSLRVYRTVFDSDGMAHITIPGYATNQVGYIALIVAAGEARGEASVLLSVDNRSSIAMTRPTVDREEKTY